MDLSRRVSDVSNTCVGGELDGCEGRIRPFPDDTLEYVSESIMLQKLARLAQAANRTREISPLLLHTLVMPLCSDSPRKCSLSGGKTA